MAVIQQAVYLDIATQYANARESMLISHVYMYSSVREIVDLTGESAVDPEVDLLNIYWNAYIGAQDAMESPAFFTGPVRAINAHVLNRSNYSSVHLYLMAYDPSYTVPYFWCELCSLTGTTIPGAHCETAPTWYTG